MKTTLTTAAMLALLLYGPLCAQDSWDIYQTLKAQKEQNALQAQQNYILQQQAYAQWVYAQNAARPNVNVQQTHVNTGQAVVQAPPPEKPRAIGQHERPLYMSDVVAASDRAHFLEGVVQSLQSRIGVWEKDYDKLKAEWRVVRAENAALKARLAETSPGDRLLQITEEKNK